MYFCDSAEKDAFILRVKRVRERLTPPGESMLSYHDLMLSMLDAVERQATPVTAAAEATSMLRHNGKYSNHTIHIYILTYTYVLS